MVEWISNRSIDVFSFNDTVKKIIEFVLFLSFEKGIFFSDGQEMPHLLRVEIVLHGAMYFVTFLDADTFPPPIRIENLSEVPILYQQKGCDASHLRTILRPHSEGKRKQKSGNLRPLTSR